MTEARNREADLGFANADSAYPDEGLTSGLALESDRGSSYGVSFAPREVALTKPLITRFLEATFVRYFAASGIALGVDASSFFVLVALGAAAGPASAAAYSSGIVVNWLITSRAVFASELQVRGPARTRQKILFVLSALAGLAITTLIVSSGAAVGANLALSKGFAVAVSFTANWLLRRWLIFPPRAAAI